MKKLILIFSFAAGFSLLGTAASAQTGILHGLTTPRPNSSGGTTYDCPPDPNRICTTNTLNPDGTHTVLIYNYDRNGKLTGTTTFSTKAGHETDPDPEDGYNNSVIMPWGEWWMKFVSQESTDH